MRKAAGFTLLEIMLVLLILGAGAGLIVATLPDRDTRPLAKKLLLALRWTSEQAEIEGQAYRLELRTSGWQLYRLEKGNDGEATFLPGYQWQPVTTTLGHHRLPEKSQLRVYQQTRALVLPTDVLFLPDGSVSSLTIDIVTEGSQAQRITWHEGNYQQGEAR